MDFQQLLKQADKQAKKESKKLVEKLSAEEKLKELERQKLIIQVGNLGVFYLFIISTL